MRALHYAIRPAELHHQALAILEIVEVEDCFLECFEAACHVLIMPDLAWYSKYIIALISYQTLPESIWIRQPNPHLLSKRTKRRAVREGLAGRSRVEPSSQRQAKLAPHRGHVSNFGGVPAASDQGGLPTDSDPYGSVILVNAGRLTRGLMKCWREARSE